MLQVSVVSSHAPFPLPLHPFNSPHSLSPQTHHSVQMIVLDQDEKLLRAFGLAVRQERERLGVSQDVFADMAKVHRTYVGSVERGERNISLKNITSFARALGISGAKLYAHAEALLDPHQITTTANKR
jgi:ribosome-binding protein aMBF1 (putative translation factor)